MNGTLNFEQLLQGNENEVLVYVVFRENTLGYLFRKGKFIQMGVLASSVIRGGFNPINGPILIQETQMTELREATQDDFKEYRVSSKGHIT